MSLSIDDLKVLQEKLFDVSNKWYNIGLQLLLNADTLDNIKSNCGSSTQDCLLEVLKKWLRRVNPYPTWKAIIDALKSIVVGEGNLAQKLEDEYCKQDSTRSPPSAQPGTVGMYCMDYSIVVCFILVTCIHRYTEGEQSSERRK